MDLEVIGQERRIQRIRKVRKRNHKIGLRNLLLIN